MNRRLPAMAFVLTGLCCSSAVTAWCDGLRHDALAIAASTVGDAPMAVATAAGDETLGSGGRPIETQHSDPEESTRWGGRLRGWWRRDNEYVKNHTSVKAAYRGVTAEVTKATAQVLADGKVVALGTVVDPRGYVVTKASLLEGKVSCRIAGGDALDATLVGVSVDHDLALLKVDASDLTAVAWRTEPAPPGTLVAAVAPDGDAIGIGVVSAEPRAVPGPKRSNQRRGWLGISLGGGDTGVGITEVIEGSAASQAGLEAGDQIQSIDGNAMRSMDQIIDTVGSRAPGDTLSILVQRQDQQLTKSAVLGKPPQDAMPEDQWGGGPFSDRRAGFPRVLPHDTVILPNQCGGPLIDTDGKVVGINIARALRVTTYAIPADIVQQFVASLK
jgi:serine protease Do